MAYGDVLAQDGDYFGPPVNLAARLVAAAEPGQVLASPATAELLGDGHVVVAQEPRLLRGIDAPVTPYLVGAA
jgi:class 3 adenylate cyclase